jgi:hypothetical protein
MRPLHPDVLAVLTSGQVTLVSLLKGTWPEGFIRITTAAHPITYNGEYYQAAGNYLGFSEIEESADFQINKIQVQLSFTDSAIIALIQDYNLVGNPISIWNAFLSNTTGQIVGDPILMFRGKTDGGTVEDTETDAIVTVDVVEEMVDFDRTNGRKTNYEQQRKLFPNDKGFSKLASVIGKTLNWK